MEDYKSRSYGDGRHSNMQNQMENKQYGLRSYSASYGGAAAPPLALALPPPKLKKGKLGNSSGSISSRSWSMNDPEFQRKKRVATYKVYSVEGKVKGSLKRSFRWLKHKYSHVVYGFW